jgi:hypothetical protein
MNEAVLNPTCTFETFGGTVLVPYKENDIGVRLYLFQPSASCAGGEV